MMYLVDKKKPSSCILDVGCGGGSLGEILTAKRSLGADGITISNEEYNSASKLLNNVYSISLLKI
jgi:cyclopropane fatty-acyl-phospholipid synthase-like methyltransferase